jgi:hypothetical protein
MISVSKSVTLHGFAREREKSANPEGIPKHVIAMMPSGKLKLNI